MTNRPIYENGATKRAEKAVIKKVCRLWGYGFRKLPIKFIVDYVLGKDGEVTSFAEVKCRNNRFDKYPDYFISLHKYMEMCSLGIGSGKDVFLIVKWTDKICYHTPRLNNEYPIRIGGREDRDDWQDREPMIHISLRDFELITTVETEKCTK